MATPFHIVLETSKDLHLPPSPPLGLHGFADATPMEFGTSTVAKMNLLFA
jgi:hypothetical protein